jgi:hypothetical protein
MVFIAMNRDQLTSGVLESIGDITAVNLGPPMISASCPPSQALRFLGLKRPSLPLPTLLRSNRATIWQAEKWWFGYPPAIIEI